MPAPAQGDRHPDVDVAGDGREDDSFELHAEVLPAPATEATVA